jgi:hypothetical protein
MSEIKRISKTSNLGNPFEVLEVAHDGKIETDDKEFDITKFNFKKDMVPINFGVPCKGGMIEIKKCIVCGKTHRHSYNSAFGSFQGLRIPHCDSSIAKQKNVKRYGIIALNLVPRDVWEFDDSGIIFIK